MKSLRPSPPWVLLTWLLLILLHFFLSDLNEVCIGVSVSCRRRIMTTMTKISTREEKRQRKYENEIKIILTFARVKRAVKSLISLPFDYYTSFSTSCHPRITLVGSSVYSLALTSSSSFWGRGNAGAVAGCVALSVSTNHNAL